MRNINLMPARRRDARRRRVHIRCVAAGCVAYTLVFGAAGGLAWSAWAGEDPTVHQQIARTDEEIARNEKALAETNARLAVDQNLLTAARQIAGQPDWSVLLALLAQKADGQMVLRSCQLRPASQVTGESKTAEPPTAGGLLLIVTGVARSPQGAQQYVLRLEKTGLFDRVTLVETRREPFLNGEASAFRVDCVLSPDHAGGSGTETKENR